jgi:hypothetical protein
MPENSTPLELPNITALVHFVIARTERVKLGHIKLNKILWYADLEHYRWHGASMTGLTHYTRTLQGPMVDDITRAVRQLIKEGKVTQRTVKTGNYARREMQSLQRPDMSGLTVEQIGIMTQLIEYIAPMSANHLSRLTREDPLWQELANNEAMSISTGSVMTQWPARARRRS